MKWSPGRTILGFPKIRVTFLAGPHNKDHNILGSILGSPHLGKLPFLHEEKFLRRSTTKGTSDLVKGAMQDRWAPHYT